MKLYQPYEEKILQLAAIKAKILRYKYVILACLLAILAGISTLLYFKGDIRSEASLQPQYTYGDTITCNAKAFLAKPSFTFYQDGAIVKAPLRVGTYSARTTARGAFGIKKYGQTQTFIVTPKSATLTLPARYTYGETPTIRVNGLVNGDRVDTNGLRFLYHDLLGNSPKLQIASGSFKILNARGEDVTDCYQFHTSVYTPQPVTFIKRAITLSTENNKKLFDGTPFDKPSYQANGLLDGHSVQLISYCKETKPGKYENFLSYDIRTQGGESVKDYYSPTEHWGKLTIYSDKLVIAVYDPKEEYSGSTVTKFTAEVIQGALLDGDSIVLKGVETYDSNQKPKPIHEAGTYTTKITSYEIRSNNGDSPDYFVELQTGTYTVKKRAVTVRLTDAEKYYNRTPLTSNKFTASNLVAGHSVEITVSGSQTEPGKTTNSLNTVNVYNAQHENVTKNYQVTKQDGLLTVRKRPVTLAPLPIVKTYDGTAIDYPSNLPKSNRVMVLWTNENDPLQDGDPLLSGDFADFTSIAVQSPIINVGSTTLSLSGSCIKDAKGNKDNGKYYEITVRSSQAEITPVQIEVHSLSHSKVADKTPLKGTIKDCFINKGCLVGNDTITYVVTGQQTQPGTSLNLIQEITIKHGSQTVGYVRCDTSGTIISGNLSSYNYQIVVSHGSLTVKEAD